MHHPGTAKSRNASEHGNAADFFLVMEFGEQGLEQFLGLRKINTHHDDFGEFHNCLPSITPTHVAPTHSTRLPSMLANALNHAPCSIRLKVSMENDENVVKPPRTPIRMPARHTALSLIRSMNSTNRKPIARQPSTF